MCYFLFALFFLSNACNIVHRSTAHAFDSPECPLDLCVGNKGTSSVVSYTPMTELDYGTLLCVATNRIGKQRQPCVFHIIAAGRCTDFGRPLFSALLYEFPNPCSYCPRVQQNARSTSICPNFYNKGILSCALCIVIY